MTFEEALEKDGRIVFTNLGTSMLPLIREEKDIMVIEPITEALKKYDAVLFRRPGVKGRGAYVLHRIVKIDTDGYYIIGDNCIDGELVREADILGILTEVKRGKRIIRSTDLSYLRFVRFWWWIYPLRKQYLKIRRAAGRLKRRVLKK